jgi:hypothetical protein
MTYAYAGWMRRTTKDRWYNVSEADSYKECLRLLMCWAKENKLKETGSMVVLPFGLVPAEQMRRRK